MRTVNVISTLQLGKGKQNPYLGTIEVVEASARCCSSFGYNSSSPYMPHMNILYADLTDEEKKKAQEKP
ncbi:hypothetical protein KY289_008534 [Solanum tuberosum]|nr:hypothetical protein KY289_008534 [Solanum tuberosum]